MSRITEDDYKKLATTMDPMAIRKSFELWYQYTFSNPNNYGDLKDIASKFIYSDDVNKRTLDVNLDFDYKEDTWGFVPALYVGIGDLQFRQAGNKGDSDYSQDMSNVVITSFMHTTLRVRCIASYGDEAAMLASLVNLVTIGNAPILRQRLGLSKIEPNSISKINLVTKTPNRVLRCDVVFDLAFNHSVKQYLEGHRLKTVSMTVN